MMFFSKDSLNLTVRLCPIRDLVILCRRWCHSPIGAWRRGNAVRSFEKTHSAAAPATVGGENSAPNATGRMMVGKAGWISGPASQETCHHVCRREPIWPGCADGQSSRFVVAVALLANGAPNDDGCSFFLINAYVPSPACVNGVGVWRVSGFRGGIRPARDDPQRRP